MADLGWVEQTFSHASSKGWVEEWWATKTRYPPYITVEIVLANERISLKVDKHDENGFQSFVVSEFANRLAT